MRSWFALAMLGCSGSSTPSGTYAITTGSCSHFHATAIAFDGDEIGVSKPPPGFDLAVLPATNVGIDGGRVGFDLTYFVRVGDTNSYEDGAESYVLDVDDAHLTGTGSGTYSGSYAQLPFDCTGSFTVQGTRMSGSGR